MWDGTVRHNPQRWLLRGRRRELWYRASLALRHVLEADAGPRALLVAHNAVNQAVLCVALGLPPARFRALVQTNAATSALRFETPTGGTGGGDGVQARPGRPSLHKIMLCLRKLPDDK